MVTPGLHVADMDFPGSLFFQGLGLCGNNVAAGDGWEIGDPLAVITVRFQSGALSVIDVLGFDIGQVDVLQHQRQQSNGARPGIRVHLPLLGAALAIGSDAPGMDSKGVKAPGRLPGHLEFLGTDLIDQGLGEGQLQCRVDDQQVDELSHDNKVEDALDHGFDVAPWLLSLSTITGLPGCGWHRDGVS